MAADYYSRYWDPYKDYTSEIDSINAAQQAAGPQSAPAAGQLMGQLGGMYAGGQIPGVMSSTTPSIMGPVEGMGGSALAGLPTLPLAGVIGGLALGGKGAYDLFKNKKTEGLGGWGGRATLGIATGGLSELARALGVFGHKSTKQYEKDRTNELLGMSNDQGWQDTINHFRAVEHPEGDTGAKFNAQESLEKAKKDGKELWGTSAVFKQFGPDWMTKLNDAQREQTTRELANKNLFANKKGDWQITDEKAANSILDEILKAKK